MKSFTKNKKERIDFCNICCTKKKLSWDHVPPKGSIALKPVEIKTIFETYHTNPNSIKSIISQNGVKFRTICQDCNSKLGSKFDPTLNIFSSDVNIHINALKKLYIPDIITISTKPNLLIRSLFGHLLSAKINFDNSKFDEIARYIINNDNIEIPEELNIFYWLYPYPQDTIVIRDIVLPSKRGRYNQTSVFQILKFYPIAFLITDVPQYENLLSLNHFKKLEENVEVKIPLKMTQVFSSFWPERPDEGNFTILSKAAFNSISAKNKK